MRPREAWWVPGRRRENCTEHSYTSYVCCMDAQNGHRAQHPNRPCRRAPLVGLPATGAVWRNDPSEGPRPAGPQMKRREPSAASILSFVRKGIDNKLRFKSR
mmetsp:Transcript_17766/g.59522  ORF Transcript_17766/g.59522 Transcript_17766/m.59522 type:complete len:102 (-) Transcript_17766:234-539(-)